MSTHFTLIQLQLLTTDNELDICLKLKFNLGCRRVTRTLKHQITDTLTPLIPGLVVVMVIVLRSPAMEEVRSEGA